MFSQKETIDFIVQKLANLVGIKGYLTAREGFEQNDEERSQICKAKQLFSDWEQTIREVNDAPMSWQAILARSFISRVPLNKYVPARVVSLNLALEELELRKGVNTLFESDKEDFEEELGLTLQVAKAAGIKIDA